MMREGRGRAGEGRKKPRSTFKYGATNCWVGAKPAASGSAKASRDGRWESREHSPPAATLRALVNMFTQSRRVTVTHVVITEVNVSLQISEASFDLAQGRTKPADPCYHKEGCKKEGMRSFAVGAVSRAASAMSSAGARRGRIAQFGAKQEWILPPRVASGFRAGSRNLATNAGASRQQQPSVAFIPILKHGGETPACSHRNTTMKHRELDQCDPGGSFPHREAESAFSTGKITTCNGQEEERVRRRRTSSCSPRSRRTP